MEYTKVIAMNIPQGFDEKKERRENSNVRFVTVFGLTVVGLFLIVLYAISTS